MYKLWGLTLVHISIQSTCWSPSVPVALSSFPPPPHFSSSWYLFFQLTFPIEPGRFSHAPFWAPLFCPSLFAPSFVLSFLLLLLFPLLSWSCPCCWSSSMSYFLSLLWILPDASGCALTLSRNKATSLTTPWSGHSLTLYIFYYWEIFKLDLRTKFSNRGGWSRRI